MKVESIKILFYHSLNSKNELYNTNALNDQVAELLLACYAQIFQPQQTYVPTEGVRIYT